MTDDIFRNLRRSAFATDPNTIPQDFAIGNGNPQPQGWVYSATTTTPADASVTTAKIVDSAVTTAKINDGAVTYAKLALPSSTQTLSAASSTISADANVVQVSPSSALTLTSTPTIGNGRDGQQMVVLNVGSNNVTLQDQGTLASSNLRLVATTITLAPRQSVTLLYSSTIGDWVQISPVVAVL